MVIGLSDMIFDLKHGKAQDITYSDMLYMLQECEKYILQLEHKLGIPNDTDTNIE